jgi:ATP-binding cassette subfamily B protein/subfamily B ATP-binding cassette protein MsbA
MRHRLLKAQPKKPKSRRASLREYIRWLKPHRGAIAFVFILALGKAALELVEPQFMKFMIDSVLLNQTLDTASRMRWLNMAGGLFLVVVLLSNLITLARDYRQKLVNTRLMLALRRSLFDRLLHLPLPRLWDMKTGGILSRLTGDVDTTTG